MLKITSLPCCNHTKWFLSGSLLTWPPKTLKRNRSSLNMSSGIDKRWFICGSFEIIPMEEYIPSWWGQLLKHHCSAKHWNSKSVIPPPRAKFPIVGLPGRYLKVWNYKPYIENLNLFLLFLPLNNSSTSICFPFDQFFLHCKYTTATTLSFQDPSGKQQIFQAHTQKSREV